MIYSWIVGVCVLIWGAILHPATGQSEEIVIQPQEEYAKIAVKKSNQAAEVLLNPLSPKNTKRKMAGKVEAKLGLYNPMAILGLAVHHLENGRLDDFALYLRFAVFRATVDVELAKDNSLNDVIPIMLLTSRKFLKTYYFERGGARQGLEQALAKATPKIIPMDKSTPRKYDQRWVSLHSIRAIAGLPMEKVSKTEQMAVIEMERLKFLETTRKEGITIPQQLK